MSLNTTNRSFNVFSEPLGDSSYSYLALICSGVLSVLYLTKFLGGVLFGSKVPTVGYRSNFEPAWLLRLRFIRGSRSIIKEGYEQFKDSVFKVSRVGADILVVSSKHVDEIRTLSQDKTRSVEPFINDFVGNYTKGLVFLESDLQNRVVQQKLTPNLASLANVMKTELDLALEKEMPKCEDEWVKVNIVPMFASIIARISARIFLGPQDCLNEEWLTTTAEYTENLFITGMVLRFFPRIMRPFVAPLIPTYRGLLSNVKTARHIVGDIVLTRRAAELEQGAAYEKPSDILQWMMDAANEEEAKLDNLSQRILILSLSSIHTTALTMTQALYDLCAHPEYFEPIRKEMTEVLQREGGWGKATLNHFRKLDSLLKESQRLSPVFLFTFQRILHQSMTLSDGTYLAAGSRIAVPSNAMLNDEKHVPGPAGPSVFDPFRYSRLREDPAHPENANRFLFVMTDTSNMAFGYGKYACPGRFYAANEMKLVLAHILLQYDTKFPDGCGRPENFTVDADMYPDRSARLMIRRRKDVDMIKMATT